MTRQTYVTGDWRADDAPPLPAMVADETWNGWMIPRFDLATAEYIVREQADLRDTLGDEVDALEWYGKTLVMRHDDGSEERIERDADGRYGIGAMAWCWYEVEWPADDADSPCLCGAYGDHGPCVVIDRDATRDLSEVAAAARMPQIDPYIAKAVATNDLAPFSWTSNAWQGVDYVADVEDVIDPSRTRFVHVRLWSDDGDIRLHAFSRSGVVTGSMRFEFAPAIVIGRGVRAMIDYLSTMADERGNLIGGGR